MGIAATDSSGKRLNFSPDQIDKMKNWLIDKARLWGRPIGAIYQDILAMKDSHPDLIKRVRIGGGGSHIKRGSINPAAFRAIVSEFRANRKLQLKVADTVSREGLDQNETRALASLILNKKDNRQLILKILAKPYRYIKSSKEIIRKNNKKHLFKRESNGNSPNYKNAQKLSAEVMRLRRKILELESGSNKSTDIDNRPFFEIEIGLTPEESNIMKMFYFDLKDPEVIAFEMGLLEHRVFALLRSAHVKYLHMRRDEKFQRQCQLALPKTS